MEHATVVLFKMRACGQVNLAAQNRLDALLFALLIELHRSVHSTVVRNGQAIHAQLLGVGHQLVDFRSAIKQAIFRMHM